MKLFVLRLIFGVLVLSFASGCARPFQAVKDSLSLSSGSALYSITINWTPPTQNTDNTPVNLNGYRIYFGTSPGTYTSSVTVGVQSSYTLRQMLPGPYYFNVKAFNSVGAESPASPEMFVFVQ